MLFQFKIDLFSPRLRFQQTNRQQNKPTMGRPNKLRNLIGILKDKASLIKATISINRRSSSIRTAILRATTAHDSSSPPSETRISAILSLGYSSAQTSSTCIQALMDRLHKTHSAPVAFKCLFIAHNIIYRGSSILRNQLSHYPSNGGKNFLNLSTFLDDSDIEMWELSSWVRWYAGIIEQSLTVARFLGRYLSDSSFPNNKKDKEASRKVDSVVLSSQLINEIEVLINHVDRICILPNSLNLQTNNLVHEVVMLVSEDYRSVQNELLVRLKEIEDLMERTSSSELTRFLENMKRIKDCRERLVALFVNRNRNDRFWDLIGKIMKEILELKVRRETTKRLIWVDQENESSESTQFWNPFLEPGQLLPPMTSNEGWLGLGWAPVTV